MEPFLSSISIGVGVCCADLYPATPVEGIFLDYVRPVKSSTVFGFVHEYLS